MPVLCPCLEALSNVPPQVCSTSSRCAAMARMSRDCPRGREDMSVEISLFQHYFFAHDQPVRRHFLQRAKHAAHVLIRVNEDDNHGQLSTCFDQMRGLDLMASEK